ncbi:uncharacterized protein LOC130380502 [Gadus chalcogrammus]|uniref:uncharacterized protein LOC130380502 n=1 Tax=Gadus chalcogrammus TaxID=1042646 RepID=UPI0024C28C06|nr:uncharacterized protein LOC130380502 [Gadus chalcogrammus]
MKLSSALLLLTSAVLGVRPSSAQGEPKYFEVGTTLTLEPDVPTVKKPIDSIRWKYGTALVVDWDPTTGHTYYGSFKERTTLDPQTLRLVINRLTLADSEQFSVETNLGTVGTHDVKVINPPPKPSVINTTNCDVTCALKCTADTKDLGPVTYEWKIDKCKTDQCEKEELEVGPWTKGEELKGTTGSTTCEQFSCRLITRLSTGEASDLLRNAGCKPGPPLTPGVIAGPLSPGVIAVIVIIVLLVAACAALIAVVLMCPELWFSIWVKNFIPGNKPADGASGGPNDKMDSTGGHI